MVDADGCAVVRWFRVCGFRGKQSKRRLPEADENRDALPHPLKAALESKHLDIPVRRALHIADGKRGVIESFQRKHCDQINGRTGRESKTRRPSQGAKLALRNATHCVA